MKVKFKDFEFDNTELILKLNGKIYPLNEKPAHLLKLFLSEPEKIHTKNGILDSVWPNRVVTDQVVFQNISLLRALFGDDAIKTFPKKGYQWQLSIQPVSESEWTENPEPKQSHDQERCQKRNLSEENIPSQETRDKKSSISSFNKWMLLGVTLIVLGLTYTFFLVSGKQNPSLVISQENGWSDQAVYQVIIANDEIELTSLKAKLETQQLFDSPFSSWQQMSESDTSRILAIRYYDLGELVVLRFHLQGKARGWQDYIWADSKETANRKLNEFLHRLSSSQYLTMESQRGATAELLVLMNQNQDNFLFNHQLIKQYHSELEFDRASALTEQMLASETSELEKGLLLLTKIELEMAHQNWPLAKRAASESALIFKQLNLPQLESVALTKSAWPFLVEEAFLAGMQVLNQAASKARISNEPLQEVTAHLIQSFIASKSGHTELMHTQLGLAKELITLHQLGEEHMVPVYYNLAWFGKKDGSSLPHYQSILDMPFSIQYESYFYIAAENLRDQYIKEQEWQQAEESIKDWQRLSFQSLSTAKILFAQEQKEAAVVKAIEAYRQAQVEHHKLDGLEAALTILQYQQLPEQHSANKEYITYIRQNATRRWLQQNSEALQALNKGNGLVVTL